ncbi:MAG TPA: QueT transporter family protein [Bacillota bacterium]|nr:QueT transporter family protein [Bacillota bacterium]
MRVRRLAEAALVAALYAILTWALAPLSYGPIQFRLAEVLKGILPFRKGLVPAFVVGVLLSNLLSPYGGAWELIFMPLANLVGALACVWLSRRSAYLGAAVYAVIVAAAVALLLHETAHLPWLVAFPPLLLSEGVLIVGGVPLMGLVQRRLAPE